MKNLLLKTTKTVAILAALFGLFTLQSCKDDDGTVTPTEEIVEDGFYIQGGATAYSGFDIKATLKTAKNEVLQEDRATLLEVYVAVKAGTEGFNIIQVNGATKTTWGPGTDWTTAMGGNEEPQVDIQRGDIEEGTSVFTVPADGLYHVVIDTETGRGAIVPVKWGFIGQATPGGWSGDTEFDAPAFDMTTMTYGLSDVVMSSGEYKFRYSGGWKVELDSTLDLGDGNKGVKFNTNYGGALDALVAGGTNMTTDQSGIYDVAITWTAGSGHSATLTRTGDVPPRDWSNVSIGLIGDGVNNGNWDGELHATTPAKDGDTYTYAFTGVELVNAGGFKLRTAGTWDDVNLGYSSDVLTGPDKADITDDGGNMKVAADGTYDLLFVIDAKAETMSLSVTKK
ncbi:MAG: hypothetical protein COA58_15520 [Bacteroidetes bacterium]|nr:MAG: hypothetical protein COA58_15520 [Bacteroidota bacterium]